MHRKCFIKTFISLTIVSKLIYLAKNAKKSSSKLDPLTFFIGTWSISEPDVLIESSIKIQEDRQVYLNKQLMDGQLVSIEKDKIIFKDHFGYELVVTKLSADKLNLFDEADEKNYSLMRKTVLSS